MGFPPRAATYTLSPPTSGEPPRSRVRRLAKGSGNCRGEMDHFLAPVVRSTQTSGVSIEPLRLIGTGPSLFIGSRSGCPSTASTAFSVTVTVSCALLGGGAPSAPKRARAPASSPALLVQPGNVL